MKNATLKIVAASIMISMTATTGRSAPLFSQHDKEVDALLAQMTQDEKIGQMVQVDCTALRDKTGVQKYFLGSVLRGGDSDHMGVVPFCGFPGNLKAGVVRPVQRQAKEPTYVNIRLEIV